MQQILWAVVIVIILVGFYWWWSSSQMPATPAPTSPFTATTSNQPSNTGSGSSNTNGTSGSVPAGTSANNSAPMSARVTFDGLSFSPANATIAQGGTVTFTSTAGPMWIASDPHPIHNGYDGTTMQQHCAPNYAGAAPLDQCSAGTTFSFTFNKVGTWGYHDHLQANVRGSVTVVASQ